MLHHWTTSFEKKIVVEIRKKINSKKNIALNKIYNIQQTKCYV